MIYQGENIVSFKKPLWWWKKSYYICSDSVMCLVPFYDSEDTIEEAIKSLYEQYYKKILVIAVNDASSDSSLFLLKRLQERYKCLFFIDDIINNGPFVSVNIALACLEPEDFGFFMKHDADDVLLESRLSRQVLALENDNKMFSTSGYARIDKSTKNIVGGKKRGHNMTLYKKVVFDELGYYDEVRFAAGSEYLERALLRFGKSSEAQIPERLTLAYLDPEKNIVSKNPLGSPSRIEYQGNFRFLHLEMKKLANWKNLNTFGLNSCFKKVNEIGYEAVVCGIASLESRKKALFDTVNSLLSQVDLIIIYQNGYKDNGGIFLNPKIRVISSLDTNIDFGDAGKYFKLSAFESCYYFSCDDDLIYPPDYVKKTKRFLKEKHDNVIVTYHGRVMNKNPISYYQDKEKVFHFACSLKRETPVHFGGTGVMAFHTSKVKFNFNLFKFANMADVWVGLHARNNNIPIVVIPHGSDYVQHSDKFDVETTIFRTKSNKEGVQDRLIKGLIFSDPLSLKIKSEKKCKIAIAIPTFNRHDFLENALLKIDKESIGYDVCVVINDDGSSPPVKLKYEYKNIEIEIKRSENLGKTKYWITVNKLLSALENKKADLYFYMADDIEIVEGFFEKSIFVWESIVDENKLSLNLLNDGREVCWTNYPRKLVSYENLEIYKSQWLDMIMMFDKRLVCQRVKEIPLARWQNRPNLSSGVGAQLSTRNHEAGYSMYQVKESLVRHGNHDSVMNYEERKLNPLITSQS